MPEPIGSATPRPVPRRHPGAAAAALAGFLLMFPAPCSATPVPTTPSVPRAAPPAPPRPPAAVPPVPQVPRGSAAGGRLDALSDPPPVVTEDDLPRLLGGAAAQPTSGAGSAAGGSPPGGMACPGSGPCLRFEGFAPLPPPRLGAISPPLAMGLGDLASDAARNARAVEDVARAVARQASGAPGEQRPPSPTSTPGPAAASGPTVGDPCGGGSADLSRLLSPACLATLRAVGSTPSSPARPGGGWQPPVFAPPPAPSSQVFCSVAVFVGSPLPVQGHPPLAPSPNGVASFQAPSLRHCVEAGVMLGFGVPGITNITASHAGGVSGALCFRPVEAPASVSCAAHPGAGPR